MSGRRGRFVVFAAPRTGSNWLCSLLDSHPEVLCHPEIFNPERIIYSVSLRQGELDLGTVEERDARPLEVLDRVWREDFGRPWVGFKLNRGQCREAFDAVLADPAVHKVLIRRSNRIKTFVSEKLAIRTGSWESYPWSKTLESKPRIRVGVEELREHIAMNERYYGWLETSVEESGAPWLEVTYEELGTAREQARLLEFLGLDEPVEGLSAITRKQGSKDLRDRIEGYGELAAALAGTELADELVDRGL